MITVACVLRSGGCYDWGYVTRLMAAMRRHLSGVEYRFICLSDIVPLGVYDFNNNSAISPLVHDWPGWWAKIELFKLPPPVLYFDLDTAIIGDITPLAKWVENECDSLMMLRGFYKKDKCSGIMGWRQDMSILYERFKDHYANRATFQSRASGVGMTVNNRRWRGDQEWLAMATQKENIPVTFVQDVFPGVYSYKVHVKEKGLPDDARVVCFHGKPRPHEVEAIV